MNVIGIDGLILSCLQCGRVPQASTGFSPFELLLGRTSRGVLDLIKENCADATSISKSEIQYCTVQQQHKDQGGCVREKNRR